MHIVGSDLGLEHLWVVYPGGLEYPLIDRITVLPLASVPNRWLSTPPDQPDHSAS